MRYRRISVLKGPTNLLKVPILQEGNMNLLKKKKKKKNLISLRQYVLFKTKCKNMTNK